MASRDPDLQAFGQAVREYRARLELSQAAAARSWGVHRTWLSNVERGRANPSFGALYALAEHMGISLAALFHRAEELRRAALDHDR